MKKLLFLKKGYKSMFDKKKFKKNEIVIISKSFSVSNHKFNKGDKVKILDVDIFGKTYDIELVGNSVNWTTEVEEDCLEKI